MSCFASGKVWNQLVSRQPSAKTQAKQDKKTSKTKVTPNKTSTKLATTPSQDAAYALTGAYEAKSTAEVV
jgi:hypothetical protein